MTYVFMSVAAVMWSMWTIYLSSHLVVKTTLVALEGEGTSDITRVGTLMRRKMTPSSISTILRYTPRRSPLALPPQAR